MTYTEMADLAVDVEFTARLGAAVTEQAKTHDDYVSEQALRSPAQGSSMFMPFVASEPGFASAYGSGGQAAISDGMILSAVQANWNAVLGVWQPITDTAVIQP